MNTIEIKKGMNRRSRGAVALAFILPFVLVAGAAAFFMSCSNPTGGDTKKPQDLVFTYNNITFTIDASVRNNYPQAEISEYLQKVYAAQDSFTVGLVAYINSKSSFKINVKPLTGDVAAYNYDIINDSELVINSTNATNAGELIDALCAGVDDMSS